MIVGGLHLGATIVQIESLPDHPEADREHVLDQGHLGRHVGGVAPRLVEDKVYASQEEAYHGVFLRRVQDLLES